MNIPERNAQFLWAMSQLTARQKKWLEDGKKADEAALERVRRCVDEEILPRIRAEKAMQPSERLERLRRLNMDHPDYLDGDYEQVGTYQASDWGE